jgi:hypothetical protein
MDVSVGSSRSPLLFNLISAKDIFPSDTVIALQTGAERTKTHCFQLGSILVSKMLSIAFSYLLSDGMFSTASTYPPI